MTYRIPREFIDDVLLRNNIVDVISSSIQLQKKGKNYLAECPLPSHEEKTASFTVAEDKQFYHCFGCGGHGNALDFLTQTQGMGFIDAVKQLASSAGMSLPKPESTNKSNKIYHAKQTASKNLVSYAQANLNTANAKSFMCSLDLTPELMKRFDLGVIEKDVLLGDPSLLKSAKTMGLLDYESHMEDCLLIMPVKNKDKILGLSIIFGEHEQAWFSTSKEDSKAGPLYQYEANNFEVPNITIYPNVLDLIRCDDPKTGCASLNESHLIGHRHLNVLSRKTNQIHIMNRPGTLASTLFSVVPNLNENATVSFGESQSSITDIMVDEIENSVSNDVPSVNSIKKVLSTHLSHLKNQFWQACICHEISEVYGISSEELLPVFISDQDLSNKKNSDDISAVSQPVFSI